MAKAVHASTAVAASNTDPCRYCCGTRLNVLGHNIHTVLLAGCHQAMAQHREVYYRKENMADFVTANKTEIQVRDILSYYRGIDRSLIL